MDRQDKNITLNRWVSEVLDMGADFLINYQ